MPNNPSGCHVQCAYGQYTTIVHNIIKMAKNVKNLPYSLSTAWETASSLILHQDALELAEQIEFQLYLI